MRKAEKKWNVLGFIPKIFSAIGSGLHNSIDFLFFSHFGIIVFLGIVVGGFFGLMSWSVHSTNQQKKEREDKQELVAAFNEITGLDTFKIVDDTVVLTVTADTPTQYDFFQEQIRANGQTFLFGQDSIDTINAIKEKTCTLYTPEFFSALDDFETVNGFEHPDFDQAGEMKYTQNFINTYCPKGM